MLARGEAVKFPKFRGRMLSMPDIPFVDSSMCSSMCSHHLSVHTPLSTDVCTRGDSRCLYSKTRDPHYQAARECVELSHSHFIRLAGDARHKTRYQLTLLKITSWTPAHIATSANGSLIPRAEQTLILQLNFTHIFTNVSLCADCVMMSM